MKRVEMSFERLWFIPMAMMIAGLALVAVFAAGRDGDRRDGAAPELSLASLLGAEYPEGDPEHGDWQPAVRLGSHDGWTYYAALDEDSNVCLIQEYGDGQDTRGAVGCARPEHFEQHGGTLGTTGVSESPTVSHLLPAGYAAAAGELAWGRVVAPNLLVVDDLESYAAGEIVLESSVQGRGSLTLRPITPGGQGPRQSP